MRSSPSIIERMFDDVNSLCYDGAGKHQVFATGPSDRFRQVARAIFREDPPEVEEAALA